MIAKQPRERLTGRRGQNSKKIRFFGISALFQSISPDIFLHSLFTTPNPTPSMKLPPSSSQFHSNPPTTAAAATTATVTHPLQTTATLSLPQTTATIFPLPKPPLSSDPKPSLPSHPKPPTPRPRGPEAFAFGGAPGSLGATGRTVQGRRHHLPRGAALPSNTPPAPHQPIPDGPDSTFNANLILYI